MLPEGRLRSVTVVGASLAGLSAARALRAQGFDGTLTLVGDEPHLPYDRPPLSKVFLTGDVPVEALALLSERDDALDVRWRLGTAATALDPARRAVRLADGSELRSDAVVLATGARARRLPGTAPLDGTVPLDGTAPLDGTVPLDGVHVLRTVDDALALRAALTGATSLVVVGAGFVGAEVASTARGLGLEVTVVEAAQVPLAGPLGRRMGEACAALHTAHGVRLRTGTGVVALHGRGHVEAVELDDGTRLAADVVVAGIGSEPAVGWLEGSGVELAGGVLTDATCATNLPGVVAVGDCAASYDLHAGRVTRAEHWTHALQQPATAAATLLGRPAPYTGVPYFWSEQYGRHIQFAGSRQPDDLVEVVEGDPSAGAFLATYTTGERLTAVLGIDAGRSFTRVRKRLRAEADAPVAR